MTRTGDELDLLLAAGLRWLGEGRRCAIATVITTWGSAPRRVGAHLLVREDGLFEGSVSGGCVEGDVVTAALELIPAGGFRRCDYGVADAAAWQAGLACGGRISILVQTIDDDHFPAPLLARILAARRAGEGVTVAIDLRDGRSREGEEAGEDYFVHHYAPPKRLAIMGAVQIAQALAPMARLAGYAPTVIEPRAMFATAASLGEHVPIDTRWGDEALADWKPDAASAVVALTHDPKLDDPVLVAALESPAFYIGALGSRRSHAARLERLAALGYDEAALARIHGPVGLAIGAANPAEIAVSILAEMIAAWRGKS